MIVVIVCLVVVLVLVRSLFAVFINMFVCFNMFARAYLFVLCVDCLMECCMFVIDFFSVFILFFLWIIKLFKIVFMCDCDSRSIFWIFVKFFSSVFNLSYMDVFNLWIVFVFECIIFFLWLIFLNNVVVLFFVVSKFFVMVFVVVDKSSWVFLNASSKYFFSRMFFFVLFNFIDVVCKLFLVFLSLILVFVCCFLSCKKFFFVLLNIRVILSCLVFIDVNLCLSFFVWCFVVVCLFCLVL